MEDGSTLPPCSVILARKDTPRLVGISVPQISFNTAQQQIGILSLLGRHPKPAHPDRLLVCLAEKAVIGFKIFAYSNIHYATEKMG